MHMFARNNMWFVVLCAITRRILVVEYCLLYWAFVL